MGADLINLGVKYVGSVYYWYLSLESLRMPLLLIALASDWDLLGTEIEASLGQTPSLPLQLLIHTAFSLAQRPYPPV